MTFHPFAFLSAYFVAHASFWQAVRDAIFDEGER